MTGPRSGKLPSHLGPLELCRMAQEGSCSLEDIVEHPNVYPELLDWLKKNRVPAVKKVTVQREGGAPSVNLQSRGLVQEKLPLLKKSEFVYKSKPHSIKNSNSGGVKIPEVQMPVLPERVRTVFSDKTVVSKKKKRVLGELVWDGEPKVALTKPTVIIGRRIGDNFWGEDTQIVQPVDPSRTVSAKHAKLVYRSSQWFVEDLGSTNGVYVVQKNGAEVEAKGVTAVIRDFYLGDVLFTVSCVSSISRNHAQKDGLQKGARRFPPNGEVSSNVL